MARVVAGITFALGLVLGSVTAAEAAYRDTPNPTWDASNTVFAIAAHGGAIYLGGNFQYVNPPAGRRMAATRLVALDRATGDPIPSWQASADQRVRALAVSADGRTLFVGGSFSTINGKTARHLAALSTQTGELIPGWSASTSGPVRDLAVAGNRLYVAGQFGTVNGSARVGLAQLDAADGRLVQGWSADTGNGYPWALKVSADGQSLIAGGNFTRLDGAPRPHLGSVSLAGDVTPWAPNSACDTCFVFDVDVDGERVYAAMGGGGGGRLNAYSTGTARLSWSTRADGNVQAVAAAADRVYAGGHFDPDFGGRTRHQLAAVNPSTGNVDADFDPDMVRPNPGVWALLDLPDKLLVGGGFTGVGSVPQGRYAEFPTL